LPSLFYNSVIFYSTCFTIFHNPSTGYRFWMLFRIGRMHCFHSVSQVFPEQSNLSIRTQVPTALSKNYSSHSCFVRDSGAIMAFSALALYRASHFINLLFSSIAENRILTRFTFRFLLDEKLLETI
jgi:hypothetical protein